jgi:hypothetical protein
LSLEQLGLELSEVGVREFPGANGEGAQSLQRVLVDVTVGFAQRSLAAPEKEGIGVLTLIRMAGGVYVASKALTMY